MKAWLFFVRCARECGLEEKTEMRKDWQGESEHLRSKEEKLGTCWRLVVLPSRGKLAKWSRVWKKNLYTLGYPSWKKWPHHHKAGGWQGQRSFFGQKEKGQSRQPT